MLVMLTVLLAALVVVALAGYLIAIAWALIAARNEISRVADGLEIVAGHTTPLNETVATINGALVELLGGLRAAAGHLQRAARVFRLG
ncbi:hypothetical protein BH23GEM9_BH23GEM9_30350 [soil metagenome]